MFISLVKAYGRHSLLLLGSPENLGRTSSSGIETKEKGSRSLDHVCDKENVSDSSSCSKDKEMHFSLGTMTKVMEHRGCAHSFLLSK